MRGLTLQQPWASLMALGAKRIETRSWKCSHTGPVAIHSSANFPTKLRQIMFREPFRSVMASQPLNRLPLGKIVAVGRLVKVVPVDEIDFGIKDQEMAFGDYGEGRFAWVFRDIVALPEPIPFKGMLNLWIVPAKPLAALQAQLTAKQIKTLWGEQ